MAQPIERLTERQKTCLRLVAEGRTSKEISRELGISPATVDNHVRDAERREFGFELLQVETRAEAARQLIAFDRGEPLTSQLISQADGIAGSGAATAVSHAAGGPRRGWRELLIPPLGGTRNTQRPEAKIVAVIEVATLGFASLFILTLGIAFILWLLR